MTGIGWPNPTTPGLSDLGDTPADASGGDLIEEDPGKHIVIGVRGFDPAGTLSSYVRMGAAPPAPSTPPTPLQQATLHLQGDDLAYLVHGFADDSRDRSGSPPPDEGGIEIDGPDDYAPHPPAPQETLDPSSPGNLVQPDGTDLRLRESSVLHTKGGWRDHTDGNRISTTRGDKVEVIRGNYRLVVMGRPSADRASTDVTNQWVDGAAGIDMSGGLNDYGDLQGEVPTSPFSGAPTWDDDLPIGGLSVTYQWLKDSHGNHVWTQTTMRGNTGPWSFDNAPVLGSVPYPPVGFYQIINNHYVDYEEDNLGSGERRVDHVEWSVYAHNTETRVDVTNKNGTYAYGWFIHNSMDINLYSAMNVITQSMIEIDTVATAIGYAGFAAANVTAQLGITANVSGLLTTDAHLLMHYDVRLGQHLDLRMGLHSDLHTGPHMELHMGSHIEDHVGVHYTFDPTPIKLNQGDQVRINAVTGEVTYEIVAGKTVMGVMPETVISAADATEAFSHHIM